MSMRSFEQTQVARRHDRYKRVQGIKRNLAQSVLLRVHEELDTNPEITTFRTPLLRQNETALRLLRNYPEEISNRLAIGRSVALLLDETVTPPELVVTLGDRAEQPTH